MTGRRRFDPPTDDQVNQRAQQLRDRTAAAADPAPLLERAAGTRAERQARRSARGQPQPMTGWVEADGSTTYPDDPAVLTVGPAAVAVQAPEVDGIIQPTVTVTPGQPVTAAATATGGRGFVGLQWVNEDATPGAITWGAGRGRITVTDIAPDTARGARMLLVVYSKVPADLAALSPTSRRILRDLRDWLRARNDPDA